MNSYTAQQVAHQHLADLRRPARRLPAERFHGPHRHPVGVWVGYRLIALGCRLVRPDLAT